MLASLLAACITIQHFWDKFVSILFPLLDQFVPKIFLASPKKFYYPKFVCKKIARRRLLWRKFKANPSEHNLSCYKKFCKRVRNIIHAFYANRENSVVDDGSRNSFYNYVNKQLNVKSSFFRLLDDSGVIVSDQRIICDVFNKYFASVHIPDDGNAPNFFHARLNSSICNFVRFDPVFICDLSKRLKPSCSLGVDGIPAIVYKKLADFLCYPLATIFEISFRTGVVPKEWKFLRIYPIFKCGSRLQVSHYRPISRNCAVANLMEHIYLNYVKLFY